MNKINVKSETNKKNPKEFTKSYKVKEIYDEEVCDHETNFTLKNLGVRYFRPAI